MEAPDAERYPATLSRIELVSSYVNGYGSLDERGKAEIEAEFRKRGLPLPDMSGGPRPARPSRPGPARGGMDRETFLSYVLLIYTGTAVFYSWYFLVERLIRRDYRASPRHRLIQTGISVFYVAADILLLSLLAGAE